jgi:K+-transporting ATPase ATPase C chain
VVVTVAANLIFPVQAGGSLIKQNDTVIGSSLIGQTMADTKYFWSRPSAVDYNPLPSAASNQGPTSAALKKAVEDRASAIRQANHLSADAVIPQDLLFASGSGLDPHISPDAARLQIDRIAQARGLSREAVASLVERFVETPQLGVFGEARVNVLLLNIALDEMK